jgi:hypothetical protein
MHLLLSRMQGRVGGPSLFFQYRLIYTLEVMNKSKHTSTTAPLYFAPGGRSGVGVLSLSIVVLIELKRLLLMFVRCKIGCGLWTRIRAG